MTTQDQIAQKTVVLHEDADDPQSTPAFLLLQKLGHDVRPVASPEQVREILSNSRVDLLVVDATSAGEESLATQLGRLPADQLPREIAIVCDRPNESLRTAVSQLQRSRVHILLKPLHIHGLLGVLRKVHAAV